MAKELLTDVKIRTTKPAIKVKRLSDGGGLFLLIKPNDSRWWRIDYSINSKRKTLSLGTYPLTTLADARQKAFELKQLVTKGVDPSEHRKLAKKDEERVLEGLCPINSFQFVADEWFNKKMEQMAESYKTRVYRRLERDIFPYIGN